MTKLKFFLTEKELLENYMEIKELQELWLTNLLHNKFIDVYDFLTGMGLEYNSDFELSTSKSQILDTLSTKSFFTFNLNQKQNSKYWEIKFQSGQNL